METQIVTTVLERDKDGTWYYIHIPKEIRTMYKPIEKRGIIPVTVTVGGTTWNGSMLPWADGSAQISVNKMVRTKENLALGASIAARIEPRTNNI